MAILSVLIPLILMRKKSRLFLLQLIAGGPVTVADQHNTVGDNLKFYQNEEMLALNADRFVGKPLSGDVTDTEKNQIWYGQMSNGDYIVGLFNRDNEQKTYELTSFGDWYRRGSKRTRLVETQRRRQSI